MIQFEVTDTGDGVASDKIETIFQPFVQADSSTSRRYQGTGLGLAICAQLIALMGGEYGVSSHLGTGSTFWFTVPLSSDAYQATRITSVAYPELAGLAVLVVDDSATQLGALTADLTDFGMRVTTVDSAHAALSALREATAGGRPYAVALIDQSMPGMDGLELTSQIANDSVLVTPLILMTGLHRDRDLLRVIAPGVSASLSKPVHTKELLACVRSALGLSVEDLDLTVGAAPFPASRTTSASGRILLAEDNLINQKVAEAMLAGAGYLVDTVPDGAAAVQAVATQRYDAVLMDCQLPGVSGYEATAAIRAREGSGHHTPIIAMTAGARQEDRDRCLAEGMDSYLSKPVRREALLELLDTSITNSRLRAAEFLRATERSPATDETLDSEVFDRLRFFEQSSGEGFLAGLVQQFVDSTDITIGELRCALEDGDGRTVGRLAHNIKESSGRIGGTRLARSCGHLERKTLTASLAPGHVDLKDVEIDYNDLRSALLEELSTRRPIARTKS